MTLTEKQTDLLNFYQMSRSELTPGVQGLLLIIETLQADIRELKAELMPPLSTAVERDTSELGWRIDALEKKIREHRAAVEDYNKRMENRE